MVLLGSLAQQGTEPGGMEACEKVWSDFRLVGGSHGFLGLTCH